MFEFDREIESDESSYSDKIDLELSSSLDIARRRLGKASDAETTSLVGSLILSYFYFIFSSRIFLKFLSISHIKQNL